MYIEFKKKVDKEKVIKKKRTKRKLLISNLNLIKIKIDPAIFISLKIYLQKESKQRKRTKKKFHQEYKIN